MWLMPCSRRWFSVRSASALETSPSAAAPKITRLDSCPVAPKGARSIMAAEGNRCPCACSSSSPSRDAAAARRPNARPARRRGPRVRRRPRRSSPCPAPSAPRPRWEETQDVSGHCVPADEVARTAIAEVKCDYRDSPRGVYVLFKTRKAMRAYFNFVRATSAPIAWAAVLVPDMAPRRVDAGPLRPAAAGGPEGRDLDRRQRARRRPRVLALDGLPKALGELLGRLARARVQRAREGDAGLRP